MQFVGVGLPAAYLIAVAHRMSIAGHITGATLRLAWRADAHTATGLTLLVAGAVTFAAGSILMARPFVRNRVALLVAVPIAAIFGMAVFGLAALLIATAAAGWLDGADALDLFSPDFSTGKRRKERRECSCLRSRSWEGHFGAR